MEEAAALPQPVLDAVVVPVGGGGLISGISVAIKQLDSRILVVGAEPELADDAFRSKAAGSVQGHRGDKVGNLREIAVLLALSCVVLYCLVSPCLVSPCLFCLCRPASSAPERCSVSDLVPIHLNPPHPNPTPQAPATIADGLRTLLGEHTWPQVRDLVDEIILVSEEDCARAMRLVFERLKLVIEGSAGTGVSVAMWSQKLRELLKPAAERRAAGGDGGPKVAVVLCGGNASLDSLPFVKK